MIAYEPIELVGQAGDGMSSVADQLRHTIEVLRTLGIKRILIVGPEPVLGKEAPDCLLRVERYGGSVRQICGTPRSVVERYQRQIIDELAAAAANQADVRFVDAVTALCDASVCPAFQDKNALYIDNAHLTPYAERQLYEFYRNEFDWAISGTSFAKF
jgi:hypothetical protein